MLPEVNRRAFFAALFAPFVARFLPKPKPKSGNRMLAREEFYRELSAAFERVNARQVEIARHYDDALGLGYRPGLRIGDTITVRRPQRFIPFNPDPLHCEYEQKIVTKIAQSTDDQYTHSCLTYPDGPIEGWTKRNAA